MVKAHWDSAKASPLGGVDAAVPAWAADQSDGALGRELAAGGGKTHVALV